jgi:hypothetical protein
MPKFILSGYAKTKLAWLKTWKISKLGGQTIKKYSDVVIVLPATFILFLNCYWLLRIADPTAAVLDFGTLSILLFNFLTLMVIFISSSFIYTSYFGDAFPSKTWEKDLKNPLAAKIISGLLWLSTVAVSYFVITRNI